MRRRISQVLMVCCFASLTGVVVGQDNKEMCRQRWSLQIAKSFPSVHRARGENLRRGLMKAKFPPHNPDVGMRLACQYKVLGDLKLTKHVGMWGNRTNASPRSSRTDWPATMARINRTRFAILGMPI